MLDKFVTNLSFCNYVYIIIKKYIQGFVVKGGFYIIYLKNNKNLLFVVLLMKLNSYLKYDSLLDIWGVDYPNKNKRFEINYLFNSLLQDKRVCIKVRVNESGGVYSLDNVFNSSNWLEREVWDMYGVFFINNNDLRRILTDYGFEGFPLRKDFPLSGFKEVRYDDGEKRVVEEAIEVSQQFRYFNFKNPW